MSQVYDKITNHEGDASSRLTPQYDKSPRVHSLVRTVGLSAQRIEDASWTMFPHIEEAQGKELDFIGAIAGVERDGFNDPEYRAAIVSSKYSSGTPEDVISAGRAISFGEVILGEISPATIRLGTQNPLTDQQARLILAATAAGVAIFMSFGPGEECVFGYNDLLDPNTPSWLCGLSELGEGGGGVLSELNGVGHGD